MFLTPYQTTACSATVGLPQIQSALQRAEVQGDLGPATTPKGTKLEGVMMVPPYVKDIKPFSMPLEFDTPEGRMVAVDVRGMTKDTGGTTFKVLAGGEYEGALIRAALTHAWMDGAANDFRNFGDIAARVFIRLLSETIVRRLHLSPFEQQGVVVACGLFYYSNFIPASEGPLGDDERERIAVAVARLTRINAQTVMNLLGGDLPRVTDLSSFGDALRHIVKSPRLQHVDAGVIIALMGGIWFGGNARQLVAVALEYPPIWFALIYQALNDRSFHNAGLTKMVETENRGNSGAQFIRDVASYLETSSDE